ncbi:MAG: hypothetical protein LBL79_13530 [Prevotella sp.]|jgi:hypothetical protein|nr:hypothetical protein [Prevotella sp.]
MKTKLKIFVLSVFSLCLVVPALSLSAETGGNADIPILSKELPSYANLQREKRSIASAKIVTLASPFKSPGRALSPWVDPEMPTDGEGDNNVGAPIGDVTLPVILLAILIYLVYRGTSTSRRRNNF